MQLADFDYAYPEHLVAQKPLAQRDASRLLVLDRATGAVVHSRMTALPEQLRAGDCLIMNSSQVMPMRLLGARASGGRAELLLLREHAGGEWSALAYPLRKLQPGTCVQLPHDIAAEVVAQHEGQVRVRFSGTPDIRTELARIGLPPLPPYINRSAAQDYAEDVARYQCVYAEQPGSAAAPTAGLHFSDDLLARCQSVGAELHFVQLHVGIDTFLPVRVDEVESHQMHGEQFVIPESTRAAITQAKAEGRRVIAVGTTSARALESSVHPDYADGESKLFIYPGYQFQVVDALLTNFHQPKSTLIMMVSALAGREHILAAYQEAIAHEYRLFSYGDAMLIT